MHFLGKLNTTGMTNFSKHQNATLAKLMQSLLRTNTLQDKCVMNNIMLLRISYHKLMNKKTILTQKCQITYLFANRRNTS